MSLRRDIHSAYDELSPEVAGLSERVVTTVLRDGPRRAAWSRRLRAPLSLVAVFVVIVVVVGALTGPRLIADWRKSIAPPQPAIPMTPLQKLEARPLNMQRQSATAHCDVGPYAANGDIGSGPMHISGSAVEIRTAWGSYFHDFLYADGPVNGPLLVRGRNLVTLEPIVFVGSLAGGTVSGTDLLAGQEVQQHLELVIEDPLAPYAWQFEAGNQHPLDCQSWQIDGPGFSETFTFA